MQPPESYRLFMRRLRRGTVIFRMLCLASLVICGLVFIITGGWSWVFLPFLTGVLFMLGMNHVRERYVSAWKVSENPQLVYWAHPTTTQDHLASDVIQDAKLLTLHLRDGTQFEVDLPPAEMRHFITWLSERNPSVRLGAYDKVD